MGLELLLSAAPTPEGTLGRIAAQIGVAQSPTPAWLVVLTGVIGVLAALCSKSLWHLDTVAHEGAHAFAAILAGRRITGVKVTSDGSGATSTVGPPSLLGSLFVTFVGYVGSSLFGLLGAALLGADRVVAVLVLTLFLLALLLSTLRNAFAVVVVVLCGVVLLIVLAGEGLGLQRFLAYTMVWFLLAVGLPQIVALRSVRRQLTPKKRRESGSDVDQLRKLTWIPGAVWLWLQLATCLVVLWFGARLMLF